MKYLLSAIVIILLTSFNNDTYHKATWYDTSGYKVHRSHPTCAYNLAPLQSKLLVTNTNTGKSCIVEVTDRMDCKQHCWKTQRCHVHNKKIDLSTHAFELIENHRTGVCYVTVTQL